MKTSYHGTCNTYTISREENVLSKALPNHVFLTLFAFANPFLPLSANLDYLNWGSLLSVERSDDIIVSPDGTFSAGFHSVGDNAYSFSIWFTKSANFTPVWMANRDRPVNGRRSALSLLRDGNLVLTDAGRSNVWETGTISTSPVQLSLSNMGNLMIHLTSSTEGFLWQSFDFPTNTLLPQQPLTKNLKLVASHSQSNYSSGFYSSFFDNDNALRLLYNGPKISSIYRPNPGPVSLEAGRVGYSVSRIAKFDLSGYFQSSDYLSFYASDFGIGPKRRLTMDFDGNLRLYSLDESKGTWEVSWQVISELCTIHGICVPNSICVYAPEKRCSCPPGFKQKDPTNWSWGCQPTFNLSCNPVDSKVITVPNTEFYGYDFKNAEKITLQGCMNMCLELCSCKAFMYFFNGTGLCYAKTTLLDGYQSSAFMGTMYIKVPRTMSAEGHVRLESTVLNCTFSRENGHEQQNNSLKEHIYLLWFVVGLGILELICIVIGWWHMHMRKGPSTIEQGNAIATTGYKRLSYEELKEATRNFIEEIGRGGSGAVYKGWLPDGHVIAVKRLDGVNQGEVEFLAELSIIGRINHMNLIQMWGFCAEGQHKLLVYEYMEHRSLAESLSSNAIDWAKRFKIAVGTAKGLAYLQEECLEWVLHCDIKPQNILLGADYHPKVADFGLSKLRDRHGLNDSSFSRVRGTRGYMAPEWIINQPITSKVDVYSYGIVVLEVVTRRSCTGFNAIGDREGRGCRSLVTWVREMMSVATSNSRMMREIMDSKIYATDEDVFKMMVLVKVALRCVEEDKGARPTISQVVEMLQGYENNN